MTPRADILTKALNSLPKNSNHYISPKIVLNSIKNKALDYLKDVKASTNKTNYANLIRDTFLLLIDHYKTINDQDNQLDIIEKLINTNKRQRFSIQKLLKTMIQPSSLKAKTN